MAARPKARLIRTFGDAEVSAQVWMRYFGYDDAATTSDGADGGVDVESSKVVAQVKAEVGKVGRPVVQQIYGIASMAKKEAALFSLGGYTAEAEEWADKAKVALFVFDLTGEPKPVNSRARVHGCSARSTRGAVGWPCVARGEDAE